MKKSNLFHICVIVIALVGFTSCSDKYYDDEFLKNSDEKLCRNLWLEEYIDVDNNWIMHTLQFSSNGSGKEGLEYFRRHEDGSKANTSYKTVTSKFTWKWINNMEGLEMDFGAEYISYFDNVWVREFYLSGNLDGFEITFRKP